MFSLRFVLLYKAKKKMHTERKIIHIDMDAFFASVEQHDCPELRGKAIAVGGGEVRGVVCAASYEARAWGVKSAMAGCKARRLCPHLIFVEPRFGRYKEVSQQIHQIFHDYTDIIEPISLDEAFLDVTQNKKGIVLAQEIAIAIKERIKNKLGLTASAGVSYNKFLAKIASDYRKPDGLCVIHPQVAQNFIAKLPVEDFWGVGRVTARQMHEQGIFQGQDLLAYSREELMHRFGKAGSVYYDFVRGIDLRPVEAEWQRKSVGCEYTLEQDITERTVILNTLRELSVDLERRALHHEFIGRSLSLKIKYGDFKTITRTHTPPATPMQAEQYYDIALFLYESLTLEERRKPIRLLGLSLSGALPKFEDSLWFQPELF